MKKLHLALLAALTLGLSGVAYADHHCKKNCDDKHCDHKKHHLLEADTNKDGVISREEFNSAHQARADKMFNALDSNKDGKVNATERKAMHGEAKAKAKEHDPEHCKMGSAKLYDKADKEDKGHE